MPKIKENYPDISLLISTYNWLQVPDLVLMSALRQTTLSDRMVAIYDGSEDNRKTLIGIIGKDGFYILSYRSRGKQHL